MVEQLEKNVFQALKCLKLKLCTAESITGGLLAESIVRQSGASDVFDAAFVTYAESSKREVLGVTVEDVYTSQCVEQMCDGVKRLRPRCRLIIATSGFAQRPENPTKEYGTYFCISYKNNKYTSFISCDCDGVKNRSRNEIREHVKNYVLMSLLDILYQDLQQDISISDYLQEQENIPVTPKFKKDPKQNRRSSQD
jgi:PncC family amidohydrolase